MAAEAGIFVPSGTQAGKAGEKLKNNGISHETLRWSPSVIAYAPAAWGDTILRNLNGISGNGRLEEPYSGGTVLKR